MPKTPLTEFPVSRLDRESDKAWAAFKEFCEMGGQRSLVGLRQRWLDTDKYQSVPAQSTLKAWSSKFRWFERVAEYDAIRESDRLRLLEEQTKQRWLEEAENYRERNRRAGAASFELAIVQIRKCTEAIQNAEFTPDQAIRAVSGVARLIEVAQSTEGTALGIDQLLRELK